MCNASQGIKNEAMRQGLEEGRKKGVIEGIKAGKIEGKIEAYLDMGLTADEISQKMGIPKETVCNIISSLTVTV